VFQSGNEGCSPWNSEANEEENSERSSRSRRGHEKPFAIKRAKRLVTCKEFLNGVCFGSLKEKQISGAKAPSHARRRNGTSKLVSFPVMRTDFSFCGWYNLTLRAL
jgi:hypothetical protein